MSSSWTSVPGVSGIFTPLNFMRRNMTIMFCAFLLSACGPNASVFDDLGKPRPPPDSLASTTAPTEQDAEKTRQPLAPMLAPPDAADRPPLPGQSGRGYGADGLPVLQPMRGINAKQLFIEDIQEPIARIKRVENAVIDLRSDFEAVLPSILRLVAIEKDMQELTVQLESLLRNEPLPPEKDSAETTTGLIAPNVQRLPLPAGVYGPPQVIPASAPAQPPAPKATPPPEIPVLPAAPPAAVSTPDMLLPPSSAPLSAPMKTPPLPGEPYGPVWTNAPAPDPASLKTQTTPEKPESFLLLKPDTLLRFGKPRSLDPDPAKLSGTQPASGSFSEPRSAPPLSAPAPLPPAPGVIEIWRLRIGEDRGKTRLVLDASKPAPYRYDLNNRDRLLTIDLPGAEWNGPKSWLSGDSTLVESYTVEPLKTGNGNSVILRLKKATSILHEGELSPEKAGEDHRIVIDLKG